MRLPCDSSNLKFPRLSPDVESRVGAWCLVAQAMGGAQKEAKKLAPKKTKEKARKRSAEKEELTMHWMNINGVRQQIIIGLPGESAVNIAKKKDLNAACMLGREVALREPLRVPTIGYKMASRQIARGQVLERSYTDWLDVKSLSGISSEKAKLMRRRFSLPGDFWPAGPRGAGSREAW